MDFTIGQAAGVISSAVVVLQLTFPLALVFILAGILADRNNAATWSVAGRILNASYWPTLLRTDTANRRSVSRRTYLTSIFSALGLVVLAVAAIVTPLGLYEAIDIDDPDDTLTTFRYIRDESAFGQATQPRDDYNASRLCDNILASTSCPGQYHGFSIFTNASGQYVSREDDNSYISSVPPDNLTEIWSSAAHGDMALVATPFDIQWRSYKLMRRLQTRESVLVNSTRPNYNTDQGRFRTQGDFKTYQSYILESGFVVREGIVADMANGGIGFRNHTVPSNIAWGADWTEPLLWIAPESVCVSNNVTIQFTAPQDVDTQQSYLVDDGGIADITRDYPYLDLNHSQTNPKLYARAWKAATLFNHNLKTGIGLTKDNSSYVGRKFRLSSSSYLFPGRIATSGFDSPIPVLSTPYTDPRGNITFLKNIDLITRAVGGADQADDGMVAVTGGLVMAGATPLDGKQFARFDPGTNWSAPLYSCVTALRAEVRDVTFFVNGSATLENLKVRSAVPHTYAKESEPLWAMEKTGLNISQVQPLWGLVDNKYENASFLETLRRSYMYVPAGSAADSYLTDDAFGAGIPSALLSQLFRVGVAATYSSQTFADYTGATSYALALRWANLTASNATVPTALSLIWTDLMINGAIGARGQLNAKFDSALNAAVAGSRPTHNGRSNETEQLNYPVSTYRRQIKYHLIYAIPAVMFLGIYALVLVIAVGLWIFRLGTFHQLRSLLNQTAVGRAVTVERYHTDPNRAMHIRTINTRTWTSEHGNDEVLISKKVEYWHPTTLASPGPMLGPMQAPIYGPGASPLTGSGIDQPGMMTYREVPKQDSHS